MKEEISHRSQQALEQELEEVRRELQEANDTIEAIRTGQIDALVVESVSGPQLFTLKSADQTYRVFIEKMTEGAVTLSTDGMILYSNSQFARMVKLDLSEVIGVAFHNFVASKSREQYQKLFDECWSRDCREEIFLQSGSGEMPVQLSLTSLELQQGVSLSIIVTDLTAQKETELLLRRRNEQLIEANAELESSNHDLQQFASVASHDLQEPLRKVQIFSHLLKEKEKELGPDSVRHLEKIIDSARRMKDLVIDILDYSKLSASDLSFEPTDLNALIRDIEEDFELMIADKKASITYSQLPVIIANKGQIRQVFQNIVSNALKFSNPARPPQIMITAKSVREKSFLSETDQEGRFWVVSIRDNGIGFNEKYVRSIFSLFERLNSKDDYEGTGIGLAIAKKIIDKHHGLITAESEEGVGSVFSILLPESR